MERRDWVAFPYTRDINREQLPRPFIPIEVRARDGQKIETVLALADSGAVDTVLDATVASNLGIRLLNWGNKVRIYVGGKEYMGYPETVEMRVEGFRDFLRMEVFFVKGFELTGLLGQEHFFVQHHICFDRSRNTAHIARNPQISFPDFSAPPEL